MLPLTPYLRSISRACRRPPLTAARPSTTTSSSALVPALTCWSSASEWAWGGRARARSGVPLCAPPRAPQARSRRPLITITATITASASHAPKARALTTTSCPPARLRSTPGQRGLYSGAGPLSTLTQCKATHCELFGSFINEGGNTTESRQTGNSYYDGFALTPALLAVIEASPPCMPCAAASEHNPSVCARAHVCIPPTHK
jgi:hypothetical protein